MEGWKKRDNYVLRDLRCCYNCRFSQSVIFGKDLVCGKDPKDWHRVESNGICKNHKCR
jgi:hypothetical protein